MNIMLQRLFILSALLTCFFLQIGFGQYFPERIHKGFVKTASKEDVARFKAAPLIIIKQELPKFKKLKKKSSEKAKDKYERKMKGRQKMTAFVKEFNSVADSMALKYYPFNKKIRFQSKEAFERLKKKNKEKKEYAILEVYQDFGFYFDFRLSTDKKPFYRFKFPIGENNYPELSEANFSFVFQRLENYLIRREKGSEYSMKIYRTIKKDLQERLDSDLPSKTLLIDRKDLHEDLKEDEIGDFYSHKFKVVDSGFMDSVILSNTKGYYYLKVIPHVTKYSRSNLNENLPRHTFISEVANHYIVDSNDGAAVFYKFSLGRKIDSEILELYDEQLSKTNVSYR